MPGKGAIAMRNETEIRKKLHDYEELRTSFQGDLSLQKKLGIRIKLLKWILEEVD
jgi:hypothetical protein